MIETINSWLAAVLGWFGMIPAAAWAVFFGLAIGGAGTQTIKKVSPIHAFFPNEPKELYVLRLRILAFFLAFLPTYFRWPDDPSVSEYRLVTAILVGFTCPIIYKVFTHFLYKRWPDIEKTLSGTEQ